MICSFAVLNRLSTKDRQLKHNPLVNHRCSFCDSNESRYLVHLHLMSGEKGNIESIVRDQKQLRKLFI